MREKAKQLRKEYRPYVDRFNKHPYALPVTVFLLLFFLSISAFVGFSATTEPPSDARVIELSIEGERQSLPSRAETVGEFLRRANIKLGRGDIVEPSQETRITDEKFHVNVYRARPVTLVDNGRSTVAYSAATSPLSVARQAGVRVYAEDRIQSDIPENILREGVIGEKVTIQRATPLDINLYGSHVEVRTQTRTVRDLLKEKNVRLARGDSVRPALGARLRANMQVFVTRSGVRLATVEEPIPMPVETVEDASLSFGVEAVRQQGSPGRRVVTYEITLRNGIEVGRRRIQQVTAEQPVKQIVARGRAVYIPTDKGQIMTAAGIPTGQQAYADFVISHESGWRANAVNGSGCTGLGQACPGSKLANACPAWQADPVCQMRFFSGYANGRYGSWQGAYNAWQSQGWW